MHPKFKIQEIFPEGFANPINKRVHSTSLFIRFTSLEAYVSCILNSVCINLYITYYKNAFFLRILFYALSNDTNTFCDATSSILVARRDNVLKEIFPPGNDTLYFPQKLLKIYDIKILFSGHKY